MSAVERCERFATHAVRGRLLLYVCTLLAYANSLAGPFQFDDFGVIVGYEPVHSLAGWLGDALSGLRPLLKLTYAACWALGLGAFGFHVANLVLHLANIELVLRTYAAASAASFAASVGSFGAGTPRAVNARPPARLELGALCAAGLFALHPLQTEAVTYISGRSSSLSTCFVLVSLLAYARVARAPALGGAHLGWLLLSLLSYGCAVMSKESAAILPLGLMLWEICFERGPWCARLIRQAPFWAMFVGVLVVVVLHPRYFEMLYELTGSRSLLASLWYQVDGIGYLLLRVFALHRLSIDPGLGLRAPVVVEGALAAIACLALLLVAVRVRRARPTVSFGLSWFLLYVFLPYVFLPRYDVVNERHMYLAGIGLWLAVGALIAELQATRRIRVRGWALGGALCALLIAMTARRNSDYRSAIALWERTVEVSPDSPRAHYNLGVTYEQNGKFGPATTHYARAVALYPAYGAARRALSRIERRSR